MKIVLIAVGSLVLLILSVFVIGALLPKHHIATRSATFRAKPEQLFALISGPPTWRPDVKKYEVVPNAGGRDMWRETDSHGQTILYEVVERKAPVLLKTRIATPDLPYGGGWTLALHDDGGSTTLRITEDGNVYNPIFRFVSRLIIGHTRSIDAYLRNLARALGQQIEVRE
jgi:Polyketide cyclase / dehydrase and lipid transport